MHTTDKTGSVHGNRTGVDRQIRKHSKEDGMVREAHGSMKRAVCLPDYSRPHEGVPQALATWALEDPAPTTPPHSLPPPSKDLGPHDVVSALSHCRGLSGSPLVAEKMMAPRLLLFVDKRSVLFCQMLHNCYTVLTLPACSRAGIK